jgi:hypothetical protein
VAALASSSVRGKCPTRWRLCALLLACTSLAAGGPKQGSAQTVSEYGLKALFLFNFTQFVEWPSTAFATPEAPLCIGILGDDPFGLTLDEAVRGESIRGRPLHVRRSRDVAELRECHIVFIAASEQERVAQILAQLDASPTLTVGESEGFARHGGVIGFYREGNRVRFEISASVARRKELKISSQLLSLGRIVEPSES